MNLSFFYGLTALLIFYLKQMPDQPPMTPLDSELLLGN